MKKKLTVQKKTGIMSTAITVIVVLCLIVVNVIASAVTEKYPVKIDLTSNKAFELSEDSIKYISDLDKDITITVMNTRDSFARGGEYYEQAITVVEQYAKYNDNITLEFVDLMANPTYASEHADLSISVNDILVACGENTQKLTAYDLFNIQQSWYGGSITSSNAEQAMTGAIMNVTSEEKTKVTFLTGHEENENINLEDLLEKNNFEVSSIMLQAEAIPEDTEILIAIAPLRDYTEEDIEKLDSFMMEASETNKTMLYFASAEQPELPVLEGWLEKWGLSVPRVMVAETDQNRVISNNAYFGIADIDDFLVTEHMTNTDIPLTMPFARPVEMLFTSNMGYNTGSLLAYSESAGIIDEDVNSVEDIVQEGPISVAAKSTYNQDGVNAMLCVFGSDMILNEQFLNSSSLANMEYFLSFFNTVAERENVFSIAPKVLGGGSFTLTQGQVLLYTVMLVIVLPIAVLAVGITIWIKRRRS